MVLSLACKMDISPLNCWKICISNLNDIKLCRAQSYHFLHQWIDEGVEMQISIGDPQAYRGISVASIYKSNTKSIHTWAGVH